MNSRTGFLLLLLGLLIVVWGVVVGGKFYLAEENELNSTLEQIETQVENLTLVSEKSELWQARKQWVEENLPKAKPDQAVRVEMSELINIPKSKSFVITDPEFPASDESSQTPNFNIARIRFNASGQLDEVLPWMHSLIVKEKLLSISYLKIKQGDSKDADFTVELEKYYDKK